MSDWKLLDEFVRVGSKWVTLIGEHWQCDNGNELEYWRVEKVDSVIILPLHRGHILCAKPAFRVGVHHSTMDFPGGRLAEGEHPASVVNSILERELNIHPAAVGKVTELNCNSRWIINSSFSNQGLWGLVAEIDDSYTVPASHVGTTVENNDRGIAELLSLLECLQCRAILLEWQHQNRSV